MDTNISLPFTAVFLLSVGIVIMTEVKLMIPTLHRDTAVQLRENVILESQIANKLEKSLNSYPSRFQLYASYSSSQPLYSSNIPACLHGISTSEHH